MQGKRPFHSSVCFFFHPQTFAVCAGSRVEICVRNSSSLLRFYFVKRVPGTPHHWGHMRDPNHVFPHKVLQGPAQFYSSVLHIHRFNPEPKYGASKKPSERNHTFKAGSKKKTFICVFFTSWWWRDAGTTPRPARCDSEKLFEYNNDDDDDGDDDDGPCALRESLLITALALLHI